MAWTPREDWARGAREHYDEKTIDVFTFFDEPAFEVSGIHEFGCSPYDRPWHVHRHPHLLGAVIGCDELELEP